MALEAQEVAVRIKLIGGAAFKAEADESAASLERIGAAGKKVSSEGGIRTAGSHVEKLGNSVSKAGSKMISAGRTLSMVGVPIAAVGYLAGKSAAQFSQAMTVLATQANMPIKTLNKVSNQVRNIATQFGATPLAAAQAMYSIESVGLRGPKAINALRASLMGTAVGLDQLSSTSEAVTTAMASHIKGVNGPVQAMAVMDKAVGLGKMHLQDLTDSFKSGIIPMSSAFGMSFQQVLATAAGLTRVGVPSSQVMARMRLTMTSMAHPTVEGAAAVAQLGIGPNQLFNELHGPGGLLAAFATLKAHADLLPRDVAVGDIADIFGRSRGIANALGILQQLPQIQKIYGGVMGANVGQFDTHLSETERTPAFKYKVLQAKFENSMITFGNAVNKYVIPMLIKLIPILTAVTKWFGQLSPSMQKFAMAVLGLTVVGGPILMFAGAITKLAGGPIALVGRSLMGVETAADGVVGVAGGAGLLGMASGLFAVVGAIGGLVVAFDVFKALLDPSWAKSPTTHQLLRATQKHGFTMGPHPTNLRDLANNPLFQNNNFLHNQLTRGQRRASLFNVTHPLSPLQGPGMGHQQLGSMQNGYSPIRPTNPYARGDKMSLAPGFDGFHFHGDFTTNVNVDGKQLAQVVNTVNRKAQNRR